MKNTWFIMAYTIVIVFLSMLVFTGIYTLFSGDLQIAKYHKSDIQDLFSFSNNSHTLTKAYETMNSDGKKEDNLSCSGGVISCREWQDAACSSDNWVAVPDGIPDACDNDDGSPDFYTGNVSNLLSPDSKKSDNDAYVNEHSIGFILPGETRTVFSFNDEIRNRFIVNGTNYRAMAGDAYDMVVIYGDFSSTGGILDFYTLRKGDAGNVVVSSKNGTIRTNSGFYDDSGNMDNTAIPYLGNADMHDMVLNITNPWTSVLRYEIYAKNRGNPLYFIPVGGESILSIPQYRMKDGKLSKRIFPSL